MRLRQVWYSLHLSDRRMIVDFSVVIVLVLALFFGALWADKHFPLEQPQHLESRGGCQ